MKGGKKTKVMDEATLIKDDGGRLIVMDVLGKRKVIEKGRIAEVDADKHEIVIKV